MDFIKITFIALIASASLFLSCSTFAAEQGDDKTISNPVGGIETGWEQVNKAIKYGDLNEIKEELDDLNWLKGEAGMDSLEEYSIQLIRFGDAKVEEGAIRDAQFYVREALRLSPNSTLVLLRSLALVEQTKLPFPSVSELFGKAITNAFRSPYFISALVSTMILPFLFAFTSGLYIAYACYFATNAKRIIHSLGSRITGSKRVWASIVLPFLFLPVVFGPLWCLYAWGLVAFVIGYRKNWLGFYTGVLFLVWAGAVPFKENLDAWLSNPGWQSVLKISGGTINGEDRKRIETLMEEQTTGADLILYSYAQLLRREGDYPRALKVLSKLGSLDMKEPRVIAEEGVVKFLSGDPQGAERAFKKAEEEGLNSAAFYYNFSKIAFDTVDTEASRKYFTIAHRRDPLLVDSLREVEEKYGLKSNGGLATISLPLWRYLNVGLLNLDGSQRARTEHKFLKALPPSEQTAGLGILLMLLSVLRPPGQERKIVKSKETIWHDILAVIPGGGWCLLDQPEKMFFACALLFFLITPLIGWPGDMIFEFEPSRFLAVGYLAILVVASATILLRNVKRVWAQVRG